MKKKEKKMIGILILVAVIIIVILFFVTNSRKQESNNKPSSATKQVTETNEIEEYRIKINAEKTLTESTKFEGLEIGNVQMQYIDEETVIIADIKNTTSETIKSTPILFKLLNASGEVIGEIEMELGTIDAGRTLQLNMGITRDVRSATNFEIEKR